MLGTLQINRHRSGQTSQNGVTAAIQQASAKTGVDFGYLVKQAKVESSLNPNAKAKGSSATGLYQFIEQTWLQMIKQHGAEHGYGQYAKAIKQTNDGTYTVAAGRGTKSAILNLRRDPAASSLMAAELATDNNAYLKQSVGGDVSDTDLYLAHFLGAQGASNFLTSMKKNPWVPAATMFPEAAQSNRGVFYANGKPLSLAQVYDRFDAKFDGDGTSPVTQMASTSPATPTAQKVVLPLADDWSDPASVAAASNRRTNLMALASPPKITYTNNDDDNTVTVRPTTVADSNTGRIGGFLSSPVDVMMMAQLHEAPRYAHDDNNRYNS